MLRERNNGNYQKRGKPVRRRRRSEGREWISEPPLLLLRLLVQLVWETRSLAWSQQAAAAMAMLQAWQCRMTPSIWVNRDRVHQFPFCSTSNACGYKLAGEMEAKTASEISETQHPCAWADCYGEREREGGVSCVRVEATQRSGCFCCWEWV